MNRRGFLKTITAAGLSAPFVPAFAKPFIGEIHRAQTSFEPFKRFFPYAPNGNLIPNHVLRVNNFRVGELENAGSAVRLEVEYYCLQECHVGGFRWEIEALGKPFVRETQFEAVRLLIPNDIANMNLEVSVH